MDASAELENALLTLERLLRESAALPHEASPGDLRKAASLRRAIAERNAEIQRLGEARFDGDGRGPWFRREASTLRAAVTSHLSAWPISSIGPDTRYVESLRRLRQAYATFVATARDGLSESPR